MTDGPIKIRRKTFDAEYMQVTVLNIEDVARWCNGQILEGDKEGQLSRKFIKVRVAFPINIGQTEAHVGDFVVRQKNSFKVYKGQAFRGTFELPDGRPIGGGSNQSKNKKKGHNKSQHQGPSPSNMPKKLADNPVAVQEAVDEVNKQIVNPEAAQAVRTEDLHASPAPVSTDVLDGNAKALADARDKIVDLTMDGASPEEINVAVQESIGVMDAVKLAEEEHGTMVVEIPVQTEEAPKPITLDELNTMPGDPRSTQEIMSENE